MPKNNSQAVPPILGATDRETMNNVYDVLAFVSQASSAMSATSTANCEPEDFSGDALRGLHLICKTLMETLAIEQTANKSSLRIV